MEQVRLNLIELDYGVFEVYPLTKGNKTKFCRMLDNEIGTEYEVKEDDREYVVVVFDVETKREKLFIDNFVNNINKVNNN